MTVSRDVAILDQDLRAAAPQLAARRHALVHRLSQNLAQRCGVPRGARVALAVSGGADSLALAIAGALLRDRGEIHPVIIHIHHHLRPEADEDARHVESFCAAWGLPFRLVDIHPSSSTENISQRARTLRYAALGAAAREAGCDFIATAHHAGDQFETILMLLCRGSEAGLAGMQWSRPLDEGEHRPLLIRPLLDVSRDECESLCRAAEVSWRDDPTNVSPDRARARVRAEVVPVLEELWPGAGERAVAAVQALAEYRAIAKAMLEEIFGPASARCWPRKRLASLPPALVRAGLRRAALDALDGMGGAGADALSRAHLSAPAAAIADRISRPRTFHWPGGLALRVTAREVILMQEEEGGR